MVGERSLLLQVVQALLGSLQALQVFHHLLHVVLGVAVLDVGEPAATHANDDGHDQHEVLEVVVSVHWEKEGTKRTQERRFRLNDCLKKKEKRAEETLVSVR